MRSYSYSMAELEFSPRQSEASPNSLNGRVVFPKAHWTAPRILWNMP